MYILDTDVLTELRKGTKVNRNVQRWARTIPTARLYVTAISIFELEIGIVRIEQGDKKQGIVLHAWMEKHLLPTFAGRILPIDAVVVQRYAALPVQNPRSDRDALIAATALVHGMTIATRDGSHFEPFGVSIVNPWQARLTGSSHPRTFV